jgi:TonB family protein
MHGRGIGWLIEGALDVKTLASLALLAAPVAAAAAPPAPAAPQWIAHGGDYQCRLTLQSGKIAVSLQLVPGTDGLEFRAGDLRWKSLPVRDGQEITVQLEPGPAFSVQTFPLSANGVYAITSSGLTRDFLRDFAQASRLRIAAKERSLIDLPLPGAARAVKALHICEEDTLLSWGIDPSERAALKSLPTDQAPTTSVVGNDDYPGEALRAEAEGTTVVRLAVGTDGRVGECKVLSSSGHASLDKRSCEVLEQRARFNPAIGADGNAVRAYVVTYLGWRIAR